MGHNLTIGEFQVESEPKERWVRPSAHWHSGTDIGAPVNSSGITDDRSNTISPGYIGWYDFSRRHGLVSVFFNGRPDCKDTDWRYEGLLIRHPGAVALTEDHLQAFKEARSRYVPEGDTDGWDLKRLEWLVFWTEYSLRNHEYPTFANS